MTKVFEMNRSERGHAVAQPLLSLHEVDTYYGSIQCLHQVTIEIMAGSLVALVGSNGAGKSTLLKTISGLQSSGAGTLAFNGQDLRRVPAYKRVGMGIAHCPEGRQIFGDFSVEENICTGGYLQPKTTVAEDLEKMYALFPILKTKRHQMAGLLSGGQQQMLAIARALMSHPRLLLLDEPSMGLAPLMVEEVFAIIAKLRQQGVTILLVEQNAYEALPLADWAYVMETGRIVLSGKGDELMHNEQVRQAYLGM
ncbi:ABC transporter ATP-binding protein [Noviherbaspirillum sp. Root189]|uniref:ABC transporter ATP-binding protein n=1 Tax=Noviherbaspirillum sp. Root189 TaxID=1736487 RepID=UPI000B15C591|nr:ABC transporter ATP-binding protein [Noviherbaspirillum sp. Root189]